MDRDGAGHLRPEVRIDDDFRANALAMQGDTVLRVSALALRLEPEPFFRQLRIALAIAARAACA